MTFDDLDSTERSQIQAAYQKPVYNNIGKLVRRGNDGHIYPLGSVVYIKNAICLTAAHCMANRENVDLSVEFESKQSFKTKYNIIKSLIHSKHTIKNFNYDIAIIKLDRCVEGIEGVDPSYDYEVETDSVGDVENGIKSNPDILTYVGYGLSKLQSQIACPVAVRKVCHAYVTQSYKNFIASGYNRMRDVTNTDDMCKKIRTWCLRKPIDLEVMPTKGMSGGATFDGNGRFIGLISFEKPLPNHKQSLINSVCFLNTLIVSFRFCLPLPLIPYPYSYERGQSVRSASLKFHKDWIEQNVSEFMKDDELRQELTVQDLKIQKVPPINKLGTFKEWGEKIMRGDVYAIVAMVFSVGGVINLFYLVRDICAVFK